MNNLFFLSGPHGSGKTTLANIIGTNEYKVIVPHLQTQTVKFHTEETYRSLLKLAERAIENYEYHAIAAELPSKIILANRCIYDVLAYNEVYYRRGWIDAKTRDTIKSIAPGFFNNEESPQAIILNPGYDVVRKHLSKRWGEAGRKWREDDEAYAKFACEAYEGIAARNPVTCYYIGREATQADISGAMDWMLSRYSQRYSQGTAEAQVNGAELQIPCLQ